MNGTKVAPTVDSDVRCRALTDAILRLDENQRYLLTLSKNSVYSERVMCPGVA